MHRLRIELSMATEEKESAQAKHINERELWKKEKKRLLSELREALVQNKLYEEENGLLKQELHALQTKHGKTEQLLGRLYERAHDAASVSKE